MFKRRQDRGDGGISYLELMVSVAIIMVLAAAAIPMTRIGVKRQKEIELKAALRNTKYELNNPIMWFVLAWFLENVILPILIKWWDS